MHGVLAVLAAVPFLVMTPVAWRRSPRYAILAALTALAWLAAPLGGPVLFAHRPLLLHAALAFPTGRLPDRRTALLPAVAWSAAVVPPLARSPMGMLVLGLLVAGQTWWLARHPALGRREDTRTSVRAAAVLALSLIAPAVGRLAAPASALQAELVSALYSVLVAAAGAVLLAGLLFRSDWRATDSVIELSETTPGEVVAALRREAGVRRDLGEHGILVEAAELLEANAALQADLARRVEEVRSSRRRLVQTGTTERIRLERLLDAGARRYLGELETTLDLLAGQGDDDVRRMAEACRAELVRTQEELDQLARGLHPRLLSEHGLGAALTDLATRCPIPVEVTVSVRRLPDPVETAVWYACTEALTNVMKHAAATRASVDVRRKAEDVVARIVDDGHGGARTVPGGGLASLADRLGALGGCLAVEPRAGGGTEVRIQVPSP